MKKSFRRIIGFLLAAATLLAITGCYGSNTPVQYDVPAIMNSILSQVPFEEELEPVRGSAELYFPDLPEGATAQLYKGSGYYANEVALIQAAKPEDLKAVRSSVQDHLNVMKNEFGNYIPAEVSKINKAVIWENGNYLLLVICSDYSSVDLILNHADDPSYKLPGSNTTPPEPTQTEPIPTSDPQPTTRPPEPTETKPTQPSDPVRPDGYPALESQNGKYSDYGNGVIKVDNSAFEIFYNNTTVFRNYASLINKAASGLAGTKTQVYCMPIPTAIGIVLPDDIQKSFAAYDDQNQRIEDLFKMMDSGVTPVRCFDNLMRHRNEYLYFRTDFHWNGTGAYYAYEAFCRQKGFTPYTLAQRTLEEKPNFLGALYEGLCNKDPDLKAAPDTILAYHPYGKNVTLTFYDKNGNGTKWPMISSSPTYTCFAGADNPLTIITNSDVTDGSVLIIVKESFGNALIPYLCDHYSTIYEIDYRYWKGDLVEFAKEKGADDLLFANNMAAIGGSYRVANLAQIIK